MTEPQHAATKDTNNSVFAFCLFLGSGATLATGQLFGFIGFIPDLSKQFGQGSGLGLPVFAVGYAIGMVAWGSWAARIGAKKVMAISLGIGGLLSLITSVSPTLNLLLLLRLMSGVALGGYPPSAFVSAVQKVPKPKILFANSAMAFGLLGSAGVAGLITKFFNTFTDWSGGLQLYGILLLVTSALAQAQTGIKEGNLDVPSPYKIIPVELTSQRLVRTCFYGLTTMATFVFINGSAQQGSNPSNALILVVLIVLLLLSFSKKIVHFPILLRQFFGLFLVLTGTIVLNLPNNVTLISLGLVTAGATLVIPASIQFVIANSKKMPPVAVSIFTCSLFIGGSISGLTITGIINLDRSVLNLTLVIALSAATILAAVISMRDTKHHEKDL